MTKAHIEFPRNHSTLIAFLALPFQLSQHLPELLEERFEPFDVLNDALSLEDQFILPDPQWFDNPFTNIIGILH